VIVVDTGPLYAAADIDDARHAACVAVFQGATEQLVVPVSVVIESSFLIERHLGPARLSNPAVDFVQACDQGRRGRECREDIDAGAGRRIGPGNRQVQRRLGRADVERLIAAYKEGNSVAQLVARFNVNRTTVLAHLDRNSVPRRQTGPKLSAEDVARAAGLYRDGLSLAGDRPTIPSQRFHSRQGTPTSGGAASPETRLGEREMMDSRRLVRMSWLCRVPDRSPARN